jgi:hypothetical protein
MRSFASACRGGKAQAADQEQEREQYEKRRTMLGLHCFLSFPLIVAGKLSRRLVNLEAM